jgi:flagellar hook-associated protein 2
MLSAPGIGSGLDINGIISQLMQLERRPLDDLERKENEYQAQLSAYGKLKSSLSTLQTALDDLRFASRYQDFSPTSSNPDAFTATADASAAAGSYDVVVNSLAAAHKISSGTVTDSVTALGTGSLDISVGGNSFNVAIDGTNNTLEGIRNAINTAADNTGVNATIITDVNGSHLVLSSQDSGTTNTISVTVNDDDTTSMDTGLSQLLHDSSGTGVGPYVWNEITAAADASLTIDGFTISSASNIVDGAIQGVTLNLAQAGGASGTVTIDRDKEVVKERVTAFVEAYNGYQFLLGINRGENGDLNGDTTLIHLDNQIRDIFNNPAASATGAYQYLSQIGVSTDKTGILSLDETALDAALAQDFDGVVSLFANTTDGFGNRMDSLLDSFVAENGLLENRTDGLNTRIDYLDVQRDQILARLEATEKRYIRQFGALDAMVAQMKNTGNCLAQQLAGLPGAASSN